MLEHVDKWRCHVEVLQHVSVMCGAGMTWGASPLVRERERVRVASKAAAPHRPIGPLTSILSPSPRGEAIRVELRELFLISSPTPLRMGPKSIRDSSLAVAGSE